MRTILLLGAGRSSTALIRYLLSKADVEGFHLVVAEQELAMAEAKLGGHPAGRALSLNAEDAGARLMPFVNPTWSFHSCHRICIPWLQTIVLQRENTC